MLRTKEVRRVTRILDDIIEEYKRETPKAKRDWRTYEQRLTQRMRAAIRELEPLIEEAISSLKITGAEKRGRKPELTLKQKTVLLLLKHLFDRSNREMSTSLVAFSLLSGVDVSYKTIERRRFGWKIARRREDRVDTAFFCTALWHNLFWLN